MEWVPYQEYRDRFFKIITTHSSEAPLRCILQRLDREGVIEKKYEGRPAGTTKEIEPYLSGFLFIRRIKRNVPRTSSAIDRKADGTYGMRADKEKARKARNATRTQTPPKTTVKNLTVEDVGYILSRPAGISERALGEMFGCGVNAIRKIRAGVMPAHLKGLLARQRSSNNQAEI